jgi:hypothetical protein
MVVLLVLVFLPDPTPNSIFPRTIFRLQVPHSTSHTTLHTKTQIPRPSPSPSLVVVVVVAIQSRKGTTAIIIHSITRSKKGEREQYYTNAKISFETTRLLLVLLVRQQNTRKFTTLLILSQSSVKLVPRKFSPPQQKKLLLTPIQSTATEECRAATTGKTTTERHNLVPKCEQTKKNTHETRNCSLLYFTLFSHRSTVLPASEPRARTRAEAGGRRGGGRDMAMVALGSCACTTAAAAAVAWASTSGSPSPTTYFTNNKKYKK